MKIVRKDKYLIFNHNGFRVVLSQLGASIVEISYNDEVLTMTPINYEELNRKNIYYGKTIGPIANRVKDGLIKIDDKEYHLSLNEKGVSNHSGDNAISNQIFNVYDEENRVVFTYIQNIEGVNISYIVVYSFDKHKIRIDYLVRTSEKFMMNLTNHTFFTLGESSLDNLSLEIHADKYIESDKDTLLPKEVKSIIDCLDFKKEKLIVKDINDSYLQDHKSKGYDHSFILKDNKVILRSPKYKLEIESDFSNVHIYSDNYEDKVKVKTSELLKNRGIAIEPTDDLLNRPILNKDEVYQRYIIYKIT